MTAREAVVTLESGATAALRRGANDLGVVCLHPWGPLGGLATTRTCSRPRTSSRAGAATRAAWISAAAWAGATAAWPTPSPRHLH